MKANGNLSDASVERC